MPIGECSQINIIMKKNLSSAVLLFLLVFASCDKNKEIKQFATDFAAAVQGGDKSQITKMYPGATDVDEFASDFKMDSIQIKEDNMTGGYKVSLGNGNWFVVTGKDKELFKIVSSHGLFAYPKEQMTFAQETGWIKKDMDDQEMRKAFADTTFYDFLFDKTVEQLKKSVTTEVNWEKSDIKCMVDVQSTIVAQVTNKGSHAIRGEDYKVIISCEMFGTNEVKGKDIAPKETIYLSTRFPPEGSERQIYNAALKFNISGAPKREVVSRYYEVKGGEYEEFLKTK